MSFDGVTQNYETKTQMDSNAAPQESRMANGVDEFLERMKPSNFAFIGINPQTGEVRFG